eukprot:322999-Prymnesium_polylepis.1
MPLLGATAWRPAPCPSNCSARGACNLDTGVCLCRQGYTGEACAVAEVHACDVPEGDELVSRCAGVCDERLLKCVCGGGKYPLRP